MCVYVSAQLELMPHLLFSITITVCLYALRFIVVYGCFSTMAMKLQAHYLPAKRHYFVEPRILKDRIPSKTCFWKR